MYYLGPIENKIFLKSYYLIINLSCWYQVETHKNYYLMNVTSLLNINLTGCIKSVLGGAIIASYMAIRNRSTVDCHYTKF